MTFELYSPESFSAMGFSRQEYQNGLSFPSPGDLPGPGIESASPVSPALQADSLPTEPSEKQNKVNSTNLRGL